MFSNLIATRISPGTEEGVSLQQPLSARSSVYSNHPKLKSISFMKRSYKFLSSQHWTAYFNAFYLTCSFMYLIPAMAQIQFNCLDHSKLSTGLKSHVFQIWLGGTIALCAPLTIELFLDLFAAQSKGYFNRLLLLFNLIIPSIVFLFGPTRLANAETVFLSLHLWQHTNWTGIACSMLNASDPQLLTPKRAFIIMCTEITAAFLNLFGNAYNISTLQIIGIAVHHLFYLESFYLAFVYVLAVYSKYQELFTPTSFKVLTWINTMSHEEYCTFSEVLASAIAILGSFLMPYIAVQNILFVEHYDEFYLCGYYCFFSMFIVIIEILPGRSAKFSANLLQTNLDVKRTFVRYVSHEIRTPLNTVYVGLELVEAQLKQEFPESDCVETVSELRSSCLIAVEILNDLLQYEKLESGIMQLECTKQFPIAFIAKIATPFLIQAEQKEINFTFLQAQINEGDKSLSGWMIDVDPSKFSQVVRNLISNAIKFTPPGGKVEVNASLLRSEKPHMRLEVIDTGHGISKENQGMVFNEIVQFNANAHQAGGGSGLGLWISKKIIQLHGGRVGLESEGDGKGCTFFLEIPLTRATTRDGYQAISIRNSTGSRKMNRQPSIARNSSAPQLDVIPEGANSIIAAMPKSTRLPFRRSVAEPTNGMNALVVDDSKINLKMTRKLLEFLGYTCTEGNDGDEAVRLYGESLTQGLYYDVILLDNQMPKMNGPEAASIIRSMGYSGMIIAVTGNALPSDVAEFKLKGADDVLIKPIDSQRFEQCVSQLRSIQRNAPPAMSAYSAHSAVELQK